MLRIAKALEGAVYTTACNASEGGKQGHDKKIKFEKRMPAGELKFAAEVTTSVDERKR